MRPSLEICVETLAAAQSAARGGADRIELCSALAEGGVTPSLGLLEQVLATVQTPIHATPIHATPIHAMVRPRAGDFCYSAGELRAMERDIALMKQAGCAGVVLGVLTVDGAVDVSATRRLVDGARPMRVTFHRAFDATPDLSRSLEDVIAAGADILLTSGGMQRLTHGVEVVARLVVQAAGRIEMMGGSAVTVSNAAALWEATGIAAIHASLRRAQPATHALPNALPAYELREEDVRALAAALDRASAISGAPLAARAQ